MAGMSGVIGACLGWFIGKWLQAQTVPEKPR